MHPRDTLLVSAAGYSCCSPETPFPSLQLDTVAAELQPRTPFPSLQPGAVSAALRHPSHLCRWVQLLQSCSPETSFLSLQLGVVAGQVAECQEPAQDVWGWEAIEGYGDTKAFRRSQSLGLGVQPTEREELTHGLGLPYRDPEGQDRFGGASQNSPTW